ncbi:DUF6286 domain-containing protein [Saccharothrix obliqua]|uniref:DUF6286 domain-containing protein n=1 Tax=Saccharothrix obliqua TaxID=2861747 RepID=UPI001C5CFC84|nr:DUF6286 domain-containing protein [Saccharothrix obliqua]MBW4717465.1 hypothetical protein [Saccharothrix obliqua]
MRGFLRFLSPFLGLAVAALGGLVIADVLWHWAGNGHVVPWPRDLAWTDDRVRTAGLITAAAGLVLLVIAAAARFRYVRLHDPADGVVVTTSPTALARVVGHRVRAEEGVSSASVTVSRRKVHVRATSALYDEATLRPRLLEVVGDTVRGLPIARTPKVSVVVSSPKDRRPVGNPVGKPEVAR